MSANSIHKGIRGEIRELNSYRKSHNLACCHYTNSTKLNFLCYLYKLDKILVILGKQSFRSSLWIFYEISNSNSAPDWTRTSTSFRTADFKSATSTISVTRAWLSGWESNSQCYESKSYMATNFITRQFLIGTPGQTRTDTLFSNRFWICHVYHFHHKGMAVLKWIEHLLCGSEPHVLPLNYRTIFL